jgi:hypothetical protein
VLSSIFPPKLFAVAGADLNAYKRRAAAKTPDFIEFFASAFGISRNPPPVSGILQFALRKSKMYACFLLL